MSRIWVQVFKHHKIVMQEASPCHTDDIKPTLVEVCKQFDIPAPMWLDKHEREFSEFRRTSFAKDHFIEDVPFDKMEVVYLADDGKTRKSADPRNQF